MRLTARRANTISADAGWRFNRARAHVNRPAGRLGAAPMIRRRILAPANSSEPTVRTSILRSAWESRAGGRGRQTARQTPLFAAERPPDWPPVPPRVRRHATRWPLGANGRLRGSRYRGKKPIAEPVFKFQRSVVCLVHFFRNNVLLDNMCSEQSGCKIIKHFTVLRIFYVQTSVYKLSNPN